MTRSLGGVARCLVVVGALPLVGEAATRAVSHRFDDYPSFQRRVLEILAPKCRDVLWVSRQLRDGEITTALAVLHQGGARVQVVLKPEDVHHHLSQVPYLRLYGLVPQLRDFPPLPDADGLLRVDNRAFALRGTVQRDATGPWQLSELRAGTPRYAAVVAALSSAPPSTPGGTPDAGPRVYRYSLRPDQRPAHLPQRLPRLPKVPSPPSPTE